MSQECYVEPMVKEVDADVLRRARGIVLTVTGMGCVNCANRVRNALLSNDGVYHVEIDLKGGMAGILCDPENIRVEELTTAVSLAGAGTRHHYRAWPFPAPEGAEVIAGHSGGKK